MKINYIEKGSGDKVVVLLHGWSGSSQSLIRLQESLVAFGYHVYNFDLPGFGGTELSEEALTLDDYVLVVTDFIKQHNINQPLLVGHSFGGKISLKIAATHPENIRAVVAIAASGIHPKNSIKKSVLKGVAKFGKRILGSGNENFINTTARKLFYKFVVREKDYYKSGVLKQTFINIVEEHLDKLLSKINIPVLLIWGELDTVTPLWMGKQMQTAINNSEIKVIAGAKHNLPLVSPEIVAEIIYNKFK